MLREIERLAAEGYTVSISAEEDEGDSFFTVDVRNNAGSIEEAVIVTVCDTILSEAIADAYAQTPKRGAE